MYTDKEYSNLKIKYGAFSSWAVWDNDNEKDTLIMDKNISQLHSNYVFLGLNISKLLKNASWSNFRGGKHDRKLKYSYNDTKLKGSYLTDIFKNLPESNSSKVEKYIKKYPEIIKKNVEYFKKEMNDIKSGKNTIFVIFGTDSSFLLRCFNDHFKDEYRNNKIINYCHYSSRGTDKAWVEGLWKKIGIKANFDSVRKKYK